MRSSTIHRTLLGILACLLPACSGITALDEEPSAPVSDTERGTIHRQVDAALEAKSYKAAWNQQIVAGAGRERLEQIALESLRNNSGHAADMFEALRKKWGALSAPRRAEISGWAEEAKQAGNWQRALHLEIASADDPPTYARAWSVYEAAPVTRAPALLEDIQEARVAFSESED